MSKEPRNKIKFYAAIESLLSAYFEEGYQPTWKDIRAMQKSVRGALKLNEYKGFHPGKVLWEMIRRI